MKKIQIVLLSMAMFSFASISAQNVFNHLGVGVGLGTDGIGIDVAAPIGDYVQVRAGYNFFPTIKPTTDIDYSYKGGDYTTKAELKFSTSDFKLLFDVYPFKQSTFRVTAGAYIGKSQPATLRNKSALEGIPEADWLTGQLLLGHGTEELWLNTDAEGNIQGRVKVNSFKPYLGIGFGRSVPGKLCSVSCDLGVQFWGKPKVEVFKADINPDFSEWKTISKNNFADDEDGYDIMKIVDAVSVYPTINIRIGFRAF